jgi:hypothetical protein
VCDCLAGHHRSPPLCEPWIGALMESPERGAFTLGIGGPQNRLKAAAAVGDVTVLCTMNDTAAAALDYGIFRTAAFSAAEEAHVIFISVGHSAATCALVRFTRRRAEVPPHPWDGPLVPMIQISIQHYVCLTKFASREQTSGRHFEPPLGAAAYPQQSHTWLPASLSSFVAGLGALPCLR